MYFSVTISVLTMMKTSVVLNSRIDHRAVADEAAQPQIALDERRHARHRLARVVAAGLQHIHLHVAAGQRAHADLRRRQMMMIEIAHRLGVLRGIGARQAGAAEHHLDVVVERVERDAAPQHLHGRGVARVLGDARAAELPGSRPDSRSSAGCRIRRTNRSGPSWPPPSGGSGDRCRRCPAGPRRDGGRAPADDRRPRRRHRSRAAAPPSPASDAPVISS